MSIRKLIKDGLIMRRSITIHSRARARRHLEAVRKGRHTGFGKRKGTREARMPTKVLWVRRQRVLRRLLRKYRQAKKLDKHQYHEFYLGAKGNLYRNKKVLIEAIHTNKADKAKSDKLQDQQEARRQKNLDKRKKKADAAAAKKSNDAPAKDTTAAKPAKKEAAKAKVPTPAPAPAAKAPAKTSAPAPAPATTAPAKGAAKPTTPPATTTKAPATSGKNKK
jgi:large subunit ribosomal protein L19e